MVVWLVEKHVAYEGTYLLGIYGAEVDAHKAALSAVTSAASDYDEDEIKREHYVGLERLEYSFLDYTFTSRPMTVQ